MQHLCLSASLFCFFLMIRRPPRSTLFPSRRSSDLRSELTIRSVLTFRAGDPDRPRGHALVFFRDGDVPDDVWRSEEHTSELQSLTNLVCRLLLEKKKKKEKTPTIQQTIQPMKSTQH